MFFFSFFNSSATQTNKQKEREKREREDPPGVFGGLPWFHFLRRYDTRLLGRAAAAAGFSLLLGRPQKRVARENT